MADTIKHPGVVENISGSHISVRIVQTSACASCSAKGHCASSDSKEKIIDVIDSSGQYNIGDQVVVIGETSMGMQAVLLAFVLPFVMLLLSLFISMAWLRDELAAGIISLSVLAPCYLVIWVNRERLKRKFSFRIEKK